MRIILLGAPGSGKGTQGDLVAEKFGFCKISSGDLLRQAVKNRTPLGLEAEAVMNRGELVDDDLVVGMIQNRILEPDCGKGYILDGFPRTFSQAQKLETLNPDDDEMAVEIDLEDNEVIRRLSARRVCAGCKAIYNLSLKTPEREGVCDTCGGDLILRDDDKPEVIVDRLKVYHAQRDNIVDHYRKKKKYFRIDGRAEIDAVFEQICALVEKRIVQSKGMEVIQ
jgi:adenylate kinase